MNGKEMIIGEPGVRSAALASQRSHLLLVLTGAQANRRADFRAWYADAYSRSLLGSPGVLSLQRYERDEMDITQGNHPPLPFSHLGVCEISVDGAEEAQGIIETVAALHRDGGVASEPATWLYYPVGEKVITETTVPTPMLAVAFANCVPGKEEEFREWYVTRHIRHALKIASLISAQCFERTRFQAPGAMPAAFSMIAIYEQARSPASLLNEVSRLPAGALDFPALDLREGRFAESIFRACAPDPGDSND